MAETQETLKSARSGAAYNAHSYHTKVPPQAIAELIRRHLPGGGVVADCFCGSGTTGVAAALAETDLDISSRYDVVLGDLSPYATFIAEALNRPPDEGLFEAAAQETLANASVEVSRFWDTTHSDGRRGTILFTIWSEIFRCPGCGEPQRFWDLAVDLSQGEIRRAIVCTCGTAFRKEQAERVLERSHDPLLNTWIERPARVPVRITYEVEGLRHEKEPDERDLALIAESSSLAAPACCPERPMLNQEGPWGDLYRSGYHQGISHVHHFYTWRNFVTIGHLWEAAQSSASPQAAQLLVSSYNLAHSTLMSRVVFKQGKTQPVLTGYQTGALYISSLPVEKNPFIGIERKKLGDVSRAFELTRGRRGRVDVVTGPAQSWAELPQKIDYAFVDPPFGANIPYAEANFIAEAWLGNFTDQPLEATISKAQGKTAQSYSDLLADCFSALRARIRKGGSMTVMFHSASSEPWNALTDALANARLDIEDVLLLDKRQGSFKQVRTDGAVQGDLLINARPTSTVARRARGRTPTIEKLQPWLESELEALDGPLDNATKRHLLSRFLAEGVASGGRVSVSAAEFYRAADQLASQRAGIKPQAA